MLVAAPASSANLGAGFDCLGLALDLPFRLAVGDHRPDDDLLPVEPTDLAAAAFRAAGGREESELRWRSPIPSGRGMGFSGAARVAGAYLGARQAGQGVDESRALAHRIAAELEGHADNAAASAYGGFVVAVGGRVVSLPVPEGLQVVMWWPADTTSTDSSRRSLPGSVELSDAVFNLGRSALWVAALSRGDLGALRTACEDRLHQDARLADRPDSAAVIDAALSEPSVLAAWLSGSGPSVAALVAAPSAESVASMLSASRGSGDRVGRVRIVDIAASGVREVDPVP